MIEELWQKKHNYCSFGIDADDMIGIAAYLSYIVFRFMHGPPFSRGNVPIS